MSSTTFRSFAGGEIAPALYARTDLVKYATGLRTCRNMLVQRHGGVSNRAGTAYVASTKSDGAVRLIPFLYNADQSYVLEFGHLYVRFHVDGAPVLSLGVPYEVVTPYTAAQLDALQVSQSADVVTIVSPDHVPATLSRLGHTSWVLADIVFGPAIAAPTAGLAVAGGVGTATALTWGVTAIDDATGAESLVALKSANRIPYATGYYPPYDAGTTYAIGDRVTYGTTTYQATAITTGNVPTNAAFWAVAAFLTVTWTAVAGARSYNVYRGTATSSYSGVRNAETLGFIGSTTTTTFTDEAVVPDMGLAPPRTSVTFTGTELPRVVGAYQQRRLLANSAAHPETVWGSKTGILAEFTTSTPVEDDDAVSFLLSGQQVNEVRHLLDLGRLVLFTSGGISTIEGNTAGTLTPTAINPRRQLYHGASWLPPIVIGANALFVQARGATVRDFVESGTGFTSKDLTIFAPHLVDGYTITAWAYQETPHSILWAVRSDGTLIALTYIPDQEVWGWHRHDTDGVIEQVCVIPEGREDRLYLCVRRTINGVTRRYIERMAVRTITALTDARDLYFVDSGLTYDGRNTGAETMTLSGGTVWDEGELLTITRSVGGFSAAEIGNAIFVTDPDDGSVLVRFTLDGYTSATVMTGHAAASVPVGLRGIATASWSRAVETFAGLGHLEGKALSVFGDGVVVSSPYNLGDTAAVVVTGGAIVLPAPYAVLHAGLPYLSDVETLDIDTPSGSSLKTGKLLVNRVTVEVESSRSFWVGGAPPTDDATDALEQLDENKVRDASDAYGPIALRTDAFQVNIQGRYNTHGRLFLRQPDPVPLTVLAILPEGSFPKVG